MAKDVLDLLEYLGWTKDHSVDLVGISMGGMISLELAKAAPSRFSSMTLISTTSGRGKMEKPLTVSLPPVSLLLIMTVKRENILYSSGLLLQWTGLSTFARLISGRTLGFDSDEYRVNRVSELLFPPAYLDQKRVGDSEERTNRQIMQEVRRKKV